MDRLRKIDWLIVPIGPHGTLNLDGNTAPLLDHCQRILPHICLFKDRLLLEYPARTTALSVSRRSTIPDDLIGQFVLLVLPGPTLGLTTRPFCLGLGPARSSTRNAPKSGGQRVVLVALDVQLGWQPRGRVPDPPPAARRPVRLSGLALLGLQQPQVYARLAGRRKLVPDAVHLWRLAGLVERRQEEPHELGRCV